MKKLSLFVIVLISSFNYCFNYAIFDSIKQVYHKVAESAPNLHQIKNLLPSDSFQTFTETVSKTSVYIVTKTINSIPNPPTLNGLQNKFSEMNDYISNINYGELKQGFVDNILNPVSKSVSRQAEYVKLKAIEAFESASTVKVGNIKNMMPEWVALDELIEFVKDKSHQAFGQFEKHKVMINKILRYSDRIGNICGKYCPPQLKYLVRATRYIKNYYYYGNARIEDYYELKSLIELIIEHFNEFKNVFSDDDFPNILEKLPLNGNNNYNMPTLSFYETIYEQCADRKNICLEKNIFTEKNL